MSKYHIDQVEEKQSSQGKAYKMLIIGGERVSIWSENPEYAKAIEGGEIEGTIVQKGQYKNFVSNLKPPAFVAQRRAGMAEAVAQKQAGIKESQENKEKGIKISSTINKAVDCAIAEFNKLDNLDSLDSLIKKWREFLWFEWEKHNNFPPFK